MLIRFEVADFRSVLDPVGLSMVAVDRDRAGTRPAPKPGVSLPPVAAAYGPNASRESNVIAAMARLQAAVHDPRRLWDGEVPVEPFAFADEPRRRA
ncbi:MAG TPA: hypothetical protein VD813_01835 [Pseudonocardia sp.]|nr:hypothetical protein [Pseudonocardia sp.]